MINIMGEQWTLAGFIGIVIIIPLIMIIPLKLIDKIFGRKEND